MNDYMLRVFAKDAGVRGFVCITTNLVNEAARRHSASPTGAAVLGHVLTAGALLGGLLKIQQTVALKIQGNGALRKSIVEADAYGRLRGYVYPADVLLPVGHELDDVVNAIGNLGLFTVIKDVGLKELAEGVVPLQTGKVDADLVYYLMQSEQVPSLVEIDARLDKKQRVEVAGGLLFQMMPDHDPEVLRGLGERLEDLPPLAKVLADGQTPEMIASHLMAELDYEILERYPLRFECSCSWARSEKALMAIGRSELESLIAEGEAVVDCHFCHERYIFGREAIEMMLDRVTST